MIPLIRGSESSVTSRRVCPDSMQSSDAASASCEMSTVTTLGIGLAGDPAVTRVNVVPRDFIIDAVGYLSGHPHSGGRTYQLADPHPLTVAEMVDTLAHATGRTLIKLALPRKVAKGALAHVPGTYTAAFGPSSADQARRRPADIAGGLVKTELIVLPHPPYDRRSIHRPLDKGESISVLEDAVFCGNEGKTMRPRRDARRCELCEVFGGGRPGDHRVAGAVAARSSRPTFDARSRSRQRGLHREDRGRAPGWDSGGGGLGAGCWSDGACAALRGWGEGRFPQSVATAKSSRRVK
jgi:hypothetical protein